MPRISIVPPGDGDQVVSEPVQMVIIEDGSTTEHRLAVGVITIPPRTDGPPAHWHAEHDEGFYVVAGTPWFTVEDGSSYDAPVGTFVMVPPGAAHAFANPGDEPAVILNTFTPDLYVGYFRDLGDLTASGQPRTPGAMVEAMARYHTYPAGQPAPTR